MAGQQPGVPRSNELPDYPFVGPFGGIQSEAALDKIGRSGFAEVQNVVFRKGSASLVSAFVPLPTQPRSGLRIEDLTGTIANLVGPINNLSALEVPEPIMGIADFFAVNGDRVYMVMTPTRVYRWSSGSWTQITGTLTGSENQPFSWEVVGYKIYFCQQADKVQVWDGVTSSFDDASADAVPAKYLFELGFHLIAANTIESGGNAPNRVRWTGAGDGTDWTSFSSGQTDLFNNLGPITGCCKLYQQGYIFQQWGITQVQLTGIGLAPFAFIPLGSKAKGNICPYSLATFGEDFACYVGKNNIYRFDGSYSIPIGDRPLQGGQSIGARSRIFADLHSANLNKVFGFISTSINGTDYESYWLLLPEFNKAWVYHFDEANWTQVFFNPGQLKGPVGIFSGNISQSPEIRQLVGRIMDQSWTPDSLINVNPLDTMAISDANADTLSLLEWGTAGSVPTSGSIASTDGWYIRSGSLTFDDPRHDHTVKKVRLVLIDYTRITINIRFKNERGQQDVKTLTYGSGSGLPVTKVVEVNLSGTYITWELSGPQGINWGMTEIAPIYDVGGEVRGG